MKDKRQIGKKIIDAIIEHAKREIPFEACGYLAQKGNQITKYYALRNMDQSNDHFTMDAKEQFAAVKDMRSKGLELAAVYHSHPETPARPSLEDIRLAYDPEISYVIISLKNNEPTIKFFKIKKGVVIPEEFEIV